MLIDEWFWFFNRSFSYVVWIYPIIYIFWGQMQRLNQKTNRETEAKKIKKMYQNSGINHANSIDSGLIDELSPNISRDNSVSNSPLMTPTNFTMPSSSN